MSKEHIWPRWLIARANAGKDKFNWVEGPATPNKAVVPLCVDCNNLFGTELEGPVSQAFTDLEAGLGLSGKQLSLLVRWLWKFEGLFWCWHHPHGRYSDLWTVVERTTGLEAIRSIADEISLGIALINSSDRDDVWPVGIDSPLDDQGVCVAGVFGRIAIASSYTHLTGAFAGGLDFQVLSRGLILSDDKTFFPAVRFPTTGQAVGFMKATAPVAVTAHTTFMQKAKSESFIQPVARRRVELPG